MRLPFSSMVLSGMLFAACCCNGPKSMQREAIAADRRSTTGTIARDYLVKGMTCGGCVFGVKRALERAGLSKNQILEVDYRKPDPERSIGHAKVSFPRDQFKGKETDCKIIEAIRKSPGYLAYLDASDTDPCHLGK